MSASIAPRADVKITKIVTSKEWVLPPRPKPGRKPSIDTPATKRKAQNRAAQRAFRERRANRVSELETKIMEMEKESSIREGLMNNQIKMLTNENGRLCKMIQDLQMKLSRAGASPLQQVSPAPSMSNDSPKASDDCAICTKEVCICDTIGLKGTVERKVEHVINTFRPVEEVINNFKPVASVPLKRRKREEETEIDFTSKFMKKPKSETPRSEFKKPEAKIPDQGELFTKTTVEEFTQCGFCSDDSPCVCREVAKENAKYQQTLKTLPPIMYQGASRKEQDSKMPKLKNLMEPSACTGNPGTCQQCQRDPMSSLFCTTLASKESNMRSEPMPEPVRTSSRSGSVDDYIPCSDAYKALAKHENFKNANITGVIGKLNTRGMLVDAGSVANVLRELDRKFSNE
ncbi:unnamed protein product [Kuraishia capsulata CBS 1993]|uniref:BZIP domain-containing protein n=1 Tax=Kuraishia capsulata CBS 1993 TaxID=1382522 RepID=W6MJK9_9ASCO|nr:uncharacterized protein KUCA_T00002438001 [Kuraishia capsulata CBS 1993]CDK26466.1 unnamed protein product [Kuraishia capsulata CBS 1993]